jgi:formylglycine-generating enzyme required for sulfatase activity
MSSLRSWVSLQRRQCRTVLLACGLAVAGAPVTAQAAPYDLAVIVTNSQYESPNTPVAEYAERDGDAVKKTLQRVFGLSENNIDWRKNQTRSNLDVLFGPKDHPEQGELWTRVNNPKARVYVYYSGHGAPHIPRDGQPEPYLLTRDGNPDRLPLTAYALQTLRENLAALKRDKLPEGDVILILEACFSGQTGAGKPLRPNTSATSISFDVGKQEGIVEIAAAEGNQVANWDPRARLGMFTNLLLWGLHGEADSKAWGGNEDKVITLAELKEYVDQRMPQQLKLLGLTGTQTAVFQTGTFAVDRPVIEGGPRPRQDMIEVEGREAAQCRGFQSRGTTAEINNFLNTCVACRCRGDLLKRVEEVETDQRVCKDVETMLQTERSSSVLTGYLETTTCARLKPDLQRRIAALDRTLKEEQCAADEVNWRSALGSNALPQMEQTFETLSCERVVNAARGEIEKRRADVNARDTLGTPGKMFREPGCTNCPEMVSVPAGCFTFGADKSSDPESYREEGPPLRLTVPRMFAIGRTEVTVGDWRACRADGKCQVEAPGGDANMPMRGVSHADAEEYVLWLATKTGKPYRLPSEAEWEYAARAGDNNSPLGKGVTELSDRVAKYWLRQSVTRPTEPVRVGSYPPNDFGLVDMLGNVAEWVADCYTSNHADHPTNLAALTGLACSSQTGRFVNRTVRGGSFRDLALRVRVSYREGAPAITRAPYIGFRVARDLPEIPPGEALSCAAPRPRSAGDR